MGSEARRTRGALIARSVARVTGRFNAVVPSKDTAVAEASTGVGARWMLPGWRWVSNLYGLDAREWCREAGKSRRKVAAVRGLRAAAGLTRVRLLGYDR